jgi:hypothetical protein
MNRPPVVRAVKIMPEPIIAGEQLQAHVDAEDPDGDPVTFRHQWFANGAPIAGEIRSTLMPAMLKRGDQLLVEVVPLDGKVEGTPYRSQSVTMPNAPPVITRLTLEPGEPHIGDRIKVEVEAKDQDEDTINYVFRWFRNNQPIEGGAGDTASVDTTGFARGDVLLVEVTPQDAFDKGLPFHSPILTIANSHPMITSTPPSTIQAGRYEYQVLATDLEGDPLTYILEAAPPGMKVNKTTGRIEWQVSPEIKGSHRVRVAVRDNHDGYAFQEFELGITPSS